VQVLEPRAQLALRGLRQPRLGGAAGRARVPGGTRLGAGRGARPVCGRASVRRLVALVTPSRAAATHARTAALAARTQPVGAPPPNQRWNPLHRSAALRLQHLHVSRFAPRRNVLLRLATTEDTAHGVLILAFGGDGTFNWLASTVMELQAGGHARFQPHIIPCPLGTGNDLSRVLGWGSSFPGLDALPRWVSLALKAPLGPQLDIWGVQFTKTVRVAPGGTCQRVLRGC